MSKQIDFSKAFYALTGHKPFPWQKQLYEKLLLDEDLPPCDIPTGLGKTAVIPIWLIALATKEEARRLPRRLVYVVNRRTIVDQSTEVVKQIRQRLLDPDDVKWKEHSEILHALYEGLKRIAGENVFPLAVSTLRGELADNEEWKQDPRCPAIIVGTVDMIGSKLLFSGYGDSRYYRPLHAGLLACDTLLIHDEAHLTPAFGKLLHGVVKQSGGADDVDLVSIMRVMELSATHRNNDSNPFTISDEDHQFPEVKKRLQASKRLFLTEADKPGKSIVDNIVRLIREKHLTAEMPQRVVVYVRFPQDAEKIAEAIKKDPGKAGNDRVSVLTGEIRGYERDRLLDKPGMRPFVEDIEIGQTLFLVATSAGEVGMDLHADQMVCDLTTLDSMIQRLGRVNRFGQTSARIDVVHEKSPKEPGRQKTLEILRSRQLKDGGIDVSPAALAQWSEEEKENLQEAFSQMPEMVELTDILVDLWAQTSLGDIPARPQVAPWLHGLQDNLPETWVAWRREVSLLSSEAVHDKELSRWFKALRIGSQEKLRMPTYRFQEKLRNKKGEPTSWVVKNATQPVVVISPSGEATRETLGRLASQELGFATVVFPVELAALDMGGFFKSDGDNKELDISDKYRDTDESRFPAFCKIVLKRKGKRYCFSPLGEECTCFEEPDTEENLDKLCREWVSLNKAIKEIERFYQDECKCRLKLKFRLQVKETDEYQDEEDSEEQWLLLLQEAKKTESGNGASIPTVGNHNNDVAERVQEIAGSFKLPVAIQEALYLAGMYHDMGKQEDCWQIAAGYEASKDITQAKAKSAPGSFDWHKLDGYRHELGSVVAVGDVDEIRKHPERDLILHLIATHHGWARPHFQGGALPPNTKDNTRSPIHREVMLRYVRLQERFGHWRLAWLESLLRRADGLTSAAYNEVSSEEDES